MSKPYDIYEMLQSYQEDVVALDCVNNIEKELKALEFIKTFIKSINLKYFFCDDLIILIIGGDDFEWQYKCKSQEEYDLLREVIENGQATRD